MLPCVSYYTGGGLSDSDPLQAISSSLEEGLKGVVLCSSAVRNAIEHDKQVNSGLSSCDVDCTSAMKEIFNRFDLSKGKWCSPSQEPD